MRKTPSQVSRCQWFKILGVRWDDIQQRPNGKDVSGATWLANCEQLTASLSRISRKLLARAKRKVCKTVNLGCNSSFCVCMCDWWDSALYHRVLAFSSYSFPFLLTPSSPPPPLLLLISLHPTTELNVEHSLAVVLLAIWCTACVCVRVCLSLYFWMLTAD